MSLFFAAFFGSLAGQAVAFWVIGWLAQRTERKALEAIVEKEVERMTAYAKLEG
jgi:hypothetical protein